MKDGEDIDSAVHHLAEGGSYALVGIRLAKKLNDVWELRPRRYRVLYFWDDLRRRYVLLVGHQKQKQRSPKRVLQQAETLRRKYLERAEG